MLNYNDALDLILNCSKLISPETEKVHILEAEGRILADDIISDIDLPPFDNSSMDGYAIEFNPEIREWDVIDEISAGNYKQIELNQNQAVLITTGSKLPPACDTVIPLEDVRVERGKIILTNPDNFIKGAYIRYNGNDLKLGAIAINKSTILTNKHIPVLAACGCKNVPVFQKLKVSVLSCGDELVDINIKPEADKIRASNIYGLLAQARKNQMEPISEGIISDDRNVIKNKFEDLLKNDSQIVITTGGVSVGKYDLIKEIWEELGAEIVFWKANIKPGKPILFGVYQNQKIIFGLPGNPLSAFVGFEIFIKPLINKIFNLKFSSFSAVLSNDVIKQDSKRHFLLGKFEISQTKVSVSTDFSQISGFLSDIYKANCLVVFNENDQKKSTGEIVECIPI